jgi:restriction system protein
MAIPSTSSMLMPLLKLCQDREAFEHLSTFFKLSSDDRREPLPSSGGSVFHNRVAWAQTSLEHSGLIESVRRGYFRITERGSMVLLQKVTIDRNFLKQYPEYIEFMHQTKKVPRSIMLLIQIRVPRKFLRLVIKRLQML